VGSPAANQDFSNDWYTTGSICFAPEEASTDYTSDFIYLAPAPNEVSTEVGTIESTASCRRGASVGYMSSIGSLGAHRDSRVKSCECNSSGKDENTLS
jgi:hypothetical protein